MNPMLEEQSTGELIKLLKDDASKLISQHIELTKLEAVKFVDEHIEAMKTELASARYELTEATKTVVRNAAYMTAGGVVFYTGFIFILISAALGINNLMVAEAINFYRWMGPLIVGVVTSFAGFLMTQKAKKAFEEEKTVPQLSQRYLKEKQPWTSKQIPSQA